MRIRFAVTSYVSDSLPVSAQRTVNAYAEQQPQGAKTEVAVFGSPGIETFATCGDGPVRGFCEMNGTLYVVSKDGLYSVASDGTTQLLGTGITGLGVVSMDGNGDQVIIVNGTLGFTYTESTTTFAQISDGDFNAANTVCFIDNYFAFDWKGTNKWFLSGLLDGTAYDPLDFASAESKPDRVVAVHNLNGVLLLFGEKTIEAWDNSGASTFPFQRFDGATADRGCAAAHAIVEDDGSIFFLGNDRVFYRLNGTQPVRISTHAIEKAWEKYTTVTDAFCFSYTYGGHKFIHVTFPTADATWGFDIASNLWHERESWDGSTATKWRINCAISAFGKTLVGDMNSGKIGRIDPTVHTEFGDTIRMVLVAPPIHGEGRRVFMPLLEVEMETGVGTSTGQGVDPQAMLDWSDDGARTFSTAQLWQSIGMGDIGEYSRRLRWKKLGSFYQRTYRLTVTDPVKRVVLKANAPGLYIGEA